MNCENNQLLKLLKKYPDKDWDWYNISANPNITINYVKNNIDKEWYFGLLSYNSNIINNSKESFDFVFNNLDKNWNWYLLSKHLNIEYIKNNIEIPWNWTGIAENENLNDEFVEKYIEYFSPQHFTLMTRKSKYIKNNISLDFILKNIRLNWCWNSIFKRDDVTKEFLLNNMEYFNMNNIKLCRWSISSNKNITLDIIESYDEKYWDWQGISANPNLTIDFIEKHINQDWNWYNISNNNNIPFHIIERFPHKPYDFIALSKRKDLNLDIVYRFKNLNWNWHFVSCNKNITYEIYKKYENKIKWSYYFLTTNKNMFDEWLIELLSEYINRTQETDEEILDNKFNFYAINNSNISIQTIRYIHNINPLLLKWRVLSMNYNINEDMIENNLDLPWDWNYISMNPNISIQFINKYIDKINFNDLSLNDFGYFEKDEHYLFSVERMKKTNEQIQKFKDELISISMIPERWMQCMNVDDYKNVSRNFLV